MFDRKSVSDLYGTMGKGYPRFKREMIRSQESNTQLFIIVEGSLTEVLKGYEYSQIKGVSMIYKLFTLWAKHGVQTIFCSSRREMAEYITQFYIALGKERIRRK
jgi:ERCC4-type nuclease